MSSAPFSSAEIERRQAGVRTSLSDGEAFVAFSFTGSFYLSGAPIVHWGRPTVTVVPKADPAFMVVSASEKSRARSLGQIDELIGYDDTEGPNLGIAAARLASALSERRITRVAIDGEMATFASIEALRAQDREITIRDGTALLNALRLVNSVEELDYIRAAVAISDEGMEAFLEEARIGRAESSLAARTTLAMADFAARAYPEIETHLRCYSQQGARTLEPHSGTSGEPLTAGNLLQVVVEGSAWHYLAAIERTIAVGELPTPHDAYYSTLVEAHEAAIDAVSPGVPCSRPHEAADAVFVRDGYGPSPVGAGLSRGIVNEWEGRIDESNLRAYNKAPLREGMVITVEPFTIVESVGATRHCDMILVTESGRERLSTSPAGRLQITTEIASG